MKRVIWKYDVPMTNAFTLTLTRGYRILSVQWQPSSDRWQLWASVDTDAPTQAVEFMMFGTGVELPADKALDHVSTMLHYDGRIVVHLFKVLDVAYALPVGVAS